MNRFLSLLIILSNLLGQGFAQKQVQGITRLDADVGKPMLRAGELRSDRQFSFENIAFWVGTGSNQAALVIEWHDGTQPDALVWGYRWEGEASGHDMITAIAKADPRLVLLTQYTGPMGYTIDGIGYSEETMRIRYDLEGAKNDAQVRFKFEPPYIDDRQADFPKSPAEDAANAIEKGLQTGVIKHPFGADLYGYPAYDYDHWTCDNAIHWAAGWYDGYWSYFVKDSREAEFTYSGLGATSRKLVNGSWDAWSYNANMNTWTGTSPGETFLPAPPPGEPLPEPSKPVEPEKPTPDNPEIFEPEVAPSDTEVTLSFPKFSEATYYIVNLYKRTGGKDAFERMIKVAPDGTILETRAGNKVSIHLEELDPGTDWHVKVDAVKEINSSETVVIGQADVYFQTGKKEDDKPEEPVTPGSFTPEVTTTNTEVTFIFPKVPEAVSYLIRLYKRIQTKEELFLTAQTDQTGSIIAMTRSGSNRVQIHLDKLEPNNQWRAEIDAIKESGAIAGKANVTFETRKDAATGIEELSIKEEAKVYYVSGDLHIKYLEGYVGSLISMKGQFIKRIQIASSEMALPVSLAPGIYLLSVRKNEFNRTFKIIITK